MISEANQVALQTAGLSFILGTRIPYLPDVVREWRDNHPGEAIPDGLTLTQPWPATSTEKTRGIPDRVIYYQFRHDRARRTLRGIDEQVPKAERAVDGHAPVKRNRYIQLTGAAKSVNRTLEAKTRALAGWKGYTTNLASASPTFVIDAYHQLWHVEKSFRMSKHDLPSPTDLSPPTRIDRGAPEYRGRSDGRQPPHRDPNRLEHQEIRPYRAPLPHRANPRGHKSSPPPTRYPTTSAPPCSRSAPTVHTNLSQVVHNRLLSPFVVVDHAGFVVTNGLIRRAVAEARQHGLERVADFGSPFPEPGAVAG